MRIILATGGTGGHIFPALATAQVLKQRGHEVVFVGALAKVEAKLKAEGFDVFLISASGFSLKKILATVCATVAGCTQSMAIIRQKKPQVVCGFGGYGSFPVVCAGRLSKIPVMIHEQNVVPGKANRVLARLASKVALSFKDAAKYFPSSKIVVTGYPLRAELQPGSREALLSQYGLAHHKPTIFVFGGSQGSRRINMEMLEVAARMSKRRDCQFIHLTGPNDFEAIDAKYRQAGVQHCVLKFSERMQDLYSIADVIVARSGAGTVWEIAHFKIPAVFIPYPGAGGHQKNNAQALADLGWADIIEENQLTSDRLMESIESFLNKNLKNIDADGKLGQHFVRNAASKLADQIECLK